MEQSNAELRAKVEHLSRPESYPDRPLAVEVIETHFAWVFLAGRLVYKLKKPILLHDCDLTTLATRRATCELEVALNRRLAPTVYVGTVPLCIVGGAFGLGGSGTPVEWLVKMHRLPRERALDRLAAAGAVDEQQLSSLFGLLARFYTRAARAPWDGRAYRRVLTHGIERTAADLALPSLGLDADQVRDIANRLATFAARRSDLLHARVAAERIVDAHGDLRPEHIFLLGPEPQVIDCLEFSAELRLQDSAAEIAFLALECDRLGHPALARRLIELYVRFSRDDVAPELLDFYRAERAFVRAKIAAWHLHDELGTDAEAHWRGRARWYLDAAAASLDLASGGAAAREPAGSPSRVPHEPRFAS